jgi:hypothetical protein
MYPTYQSPLGIAVDIREVVRDFQDVTNMAGIYKRFPLKDMIQVILSVNQYISYNDTIWFEVESRMAGDMEHIDFNVLELFFETLAFGVDEHIRRFLPDYIDQSEYIFDKWVDSTTILLRRDDTTSFYRDRGTDECIQPTLQRYQIHPGI